MSKKELPRSRDPKWQKSSAKLVAPWSLISLSPLDQVSEAYISIVASMSTSVEVVCCCSSIRSECGNRTQDRNRDKENHMTCYFAP